MSEGPRPVRGAVGQNAARAAALGVAALCLAPALGLAVRGLNVDPDAWRHVWTVVAPIYLWQTILITIGVGVLTGAGGAIAAWLTVMCRFPGRAILEWALILPLAAPAYVIAYAWSDMSGPGGPLSAIGLPQTSGAWGALFVYCITLYPYVYLAARAAFVAQSVCALEAARTLGCSPLTAFLRAGLPLARPALAAGAALAMMEAASDFGAADHLGAQTLAVGVYRAWFSLGDPGTAARLGLILMGAALLLILIERQTRSQVGAGGASTRWRSLARMDLTGWHGLAATTFCATPVALGFLLPAGWLTARALHTEQTDIDGLVNAGLVTIALAAVAALVITVLSLILAASARGGDTLARIFVRLSTASYAAPGIVLALGALIAAQTLASATGLSATGLSAAGALAILIWVYTARFAATGLGPAEAALDRVSPNMTYAARTLGADRAFTLLRVDAPIAAPGILTGLLIAFAEVMKELPATLVMRPFNMDTLAVRAHALAGDERLAEAALPALMIVLAGLGPIVWLSRQIIGARAGAHLQTLHVAEAAR